MDIRLSARAVVVPQPPDPTAVFSAATADTTLAVITTKDVLRRYRYKRLLRPPLVVAVPAPVELSGPRMLLARTPRTYRRTTPRFGVFGYLPPVAVSGFLLQENGDKIILEDGTGFILL